MPGKRSSRATIVDVAQRAGVGTATAGRVLGGYGYTSAETRRRVLESAEQLGYRPNLLARGLMTGATKTIGVVAGDVQSPFYAAVVRGIDDEVRANGFGILLTNTDEQADREVEAVRLLMEKQVDGLIVAPGDTVDAGHLHGVLASGTPLVQIDRRVAGLGADSVTVDNIGAARRCTRDLLTAGHARIAILAELERWADGGLTEFLDASRAKNFDATNLFPSWQRLLGFLQAHWEAGLEVEPAQIARTGSYSAEKARAAVRQLLEAPSPPTALFASDGMMSAAAMAALHDLGLVLPVDISFVSFDDLDWMQFHQPPISAIRQPLAALGRESARLVLERIGGNRDTVSHLVLSPEFQARASVREMPGSRVAAS